MAQIKTMITKIHQVLFFLLFFGQKKKKRRERTWLYVIYIISYLARFKYCLSAVGVVVFSSLVGDNEIEDLFWRELMMYKTHDGRFMRSFEYV